MMMHSRTQAVILLLFACVFGFFLRSGVDRLLEDDSHQPLPQTVVGKDADKPVEILPVFDDSETIREKAEELEAAAATESVEPMAEVDVGTEYVVRALKLTVRSRPDRRSDVVRFLEEGDYVTGYDRVGRWVRIGPSAYVSSTYLLPRIASLPVRDQGTAHH